MYTILLIEDDEKIRSLVARELAKWDFTVEAVDGSADVLADFVRMQPHLVLMDINLPQRDGFYWCSRIREVSRTPVIFLSCRDTAMDIVMAVSMGGDDYITKPFSLEVLVAKVNALLRRTYAYRDEASRVVEAGGAVLDLAGGVLRCGERSVDLTRNELRILHLLMTHSGTVVSRERIIRELWDDESFIDDNTLTVNINRLRRRLGDVGLPDFIRTVKNQGYRIS